MRVFEVDLFCSCKQTFITSDPGFRVVAEDIAI